MEISMICNVFERHIGYNCPFGLGLGFMVLSATFSDISIISLQSDLLWVILGVSSLL